MGAKGPPETALIRSDPTPATESSPRPTIMLVLTTLVWGLSFPWMKSWQLSAANCPGGELLASFTLIAVRMPLAVLLLALWQPRLLTAPTRREHAAGTLLGSVFFLGFGLQVWGLAYTTPALSAFFTSLCSAWVPLLGWACLRLQATRLTLLGLVVALGGTAVLVEGGWRVGFGEQLTFIAALVFAVQILILDRLARRVRSSHVTMSFLIVSGLLGTACALAAAATGPGVVAWLDWLSDLLQQPAVLANLACMALLPTLGFHWMNTYQPQVPANRAALIYLLEPVFAAVVSVGWDYEPMTLHLLLGGVLIVVGNLLVELPAWLRTPARSIVEE
jgi:drug/metabolite transporter (DMT)-like permease